LFGDSLRNAHWCAQEVIEQLSDAMLVHGIPQYIRSDNRPKLVARMLRDWLKELGVQTAYIEPGSPWENGYAKASTAP